MKTAFGLASVLLGVAVAGPSPAGASDARPLQVAAAQGVCTDIKMPWHDVDPCAGRPRAQPATPLAAPAQQGGACTEIKMPWHDVDPCAGRLSPATQAAAPVPQPGRRPGCTDIKMPWHDVDPCALPGGNAGPVAGPANRPPAPAPRPAPAPPPAPVQTAAGLKVGDFVEFDRFSDGSWGRFGTIVRLNGDPNSACPSYHVQESGGGITLSYVCGRVRAAAQRPGPAPQPAPAASPPLGQYFCTYGVGRQQLLGPGRNFWLRAGNQYAADDGDAGIYSYADGRITFRGGYFGRMGAVGVVTAGRNSQIDIHPPGGVLSYCSLQ